MTGVPTLELDRVSKAYPGTQALQSVSLRVEAGHVHALLGENGAGKSTLIKIVAGVVPADRGRVLLDGVALEHPSPRAAQRLGVRVVHQERQIAPDLTVGQNVLLEAPPRNRARLTTRRNVHAAAQRQLDRLGINLDARWPAARLSAADQQLVELARAVSRQARLVVLDEPTASLRRDEVLTLFRVVDRLRGEGSAVLYISHHLDEVFEIADRATVLRNGCHVSDLNVAETNRDELVTLMFGHAVSRARLGRVPAARSPVLQAYGVALPPVLAPVDVTVRAGEVLALSGAAGSGAAELASLLAAVVAPASGRVLLTHGTDDGTGGRRLGSRPAAVAAGIGYLPADRKRDGLLLERSVAENVLLVPRRGARYAGHWPAAARRRAEQAVQTGHVKTSGVTQPVLALSGGNQQKVVLTRWLISGTRVLVLDEPTAGVDVASKLEIYQALLDLAEQGMAVVVVSSDYEEIACLADRVLVMREGQVVAELDGEQATADHLYRLESAA